MGEVVRTTAAPPRIGEAATRTLSNAELQPAEIKAVVEARIRDGLERYRTTGTALEQARTALATLFTQVLRADGTADQVIKLTRDELYNLLGRPLQSPVLEQVYPGGVGTYTNAPPVQQPLLMQVLESRLAAIEHPAIPQVRKDGWVANVRAARLPYEEALKPWLAAEALEFITEKEHRDAARHLGLCLSRLKRDLKNLGLTETQIHQIIPDES